MQVNWNTPIVKHNNIEDRQFGNVQNSLSETMQAVNLFDMNKPVDQQAIALQNKVIANPTLANIAALESYLENLNTVSTPNIRTTFDFMHEQRFVPDELVDVEDRNAFLVGDPYTGNDFIGTMTPATFRTQKSATIDQGLKAHELGNINLIESEGFNAVGLLEQTSHDSSRSYAKSLNANVNGHSVELTKDGKVIIDGKEKDHSAGTIDLGNGYSIKLTDAIDNHYTDKNGKVKKGVDVGTNIEIVTPETTLTSRRDGYKGDDFWSFMATKHDDNGVEDKGFLLNMAAYKPAEGTSKQEMQAEVDKMLANNAVQSSEIMGKELQQRDGEMQHRFGARYTEQTPDNPPPPPTPKPEPKDHSAKFRGVKEEQVEIKQDKFKGISVHGPVGGDRREDTPFDPEKSKKIIIGGNKVRFASEKDLDKWNNYMNNHKKGETLKYQGLLRNGKKVWVEYDHGEARGYMDDKARILKGTDEKGNIKTKTKKSKFNFELDNINKGQLFSNLKAIGAKLNGQEKKAIASELKDVNKLLKKIDRASGQDKRELKAELRQERAELQSVVADIVANDNITKTKFKVR